MESPFLLQAWVVSLGKVSYSKGVLSKESEQNLSLRPRLPVAGGIANQAADLERATEVTQTPKGYGLNSALVTLALPSLRTSQPSSIPLPIAGLGSASSQAGAGV